MTLIVSQLCRGFVAQVTDRLVVTQQYGAPPARFDPLANKNIVYLARDAIVSIAYTGLAFIGQLSTDDWIVEKLTRINPLEEFGIRTGSLPQWLDIGQAMRLLEGELNNSEVARNNANFDLVITGWKWKNGRRSPEGRRQPVPMAWWLQKPANSRFESFQHLKRHWHWSGRVYFHSAPDSNFSPEQLGVLGDKARAAKPDLIEQTIVDAVREVSFQNPYVGPNCMSILLAPPQVRAYARIKFFQYERHTARLQSQNFISDDLPAAYSPWIIGNGLAAKPSAFLGTGWHFQMGPFTIELIGFDTGRLSALSHQRRPRRPMH